MSDHSLSDSQRLLNLADQHDLLDDESVQRLVGAAAVTPNDRLVTDATRLLTRRALQQQFYPFPTEPPHGNLRFGSAFSGEELALSDDQFTKHLLTVGQSGAGKTTFFYTLMDQLPVPFWSFDLKQDYRHLVTDSDVAVIPWSELRFNPLKPPPGVPPRRWAQVVSEIFGHATALLSGSKNYLLKQVIELYRLYGLFEEVSPPYPSLHELQQLIDADGLNYVRKAANYRDTVLNRLETMTLVAGTVVDCSEGYALDALLDRNVVFEFDGLNRDVQNFLMEILFAAVYEYRLAQNQRDDGLQHVFFLDEGKRVFSVYKEQQDAAGIPEIDALTAKLREFGEGLVVADQEASKLTDSIKANTFTKVLLPTGDRKQFKSMAEAMQLSDRQREYAQRLSTGEAIVQVGNRDPVPVSLDDYQLEKTVSDTELERLQAEEWNQLSYTDRETTPRFEQEVAPGRSEAVDEPEIVDDPSEVDVTEEADRLLTDIVESPFKPLTQRYQRFSSDYKGNKAKNELVESGVVVEREVRTGSGERKLLEFTDKGRDYIEQELELETTHSGRGGIIHRFWQHRIMELFEEAGWTAETEVFDADVYVNMGSLELAVEVAMGNNAREIEHVEKHLEKFPVWIACRNEDVRDGLRQRLDENEISRESVVFRLFRDFRDGEQLPL